MSYKHSPPGTKMMALTSASQSQNPTLILIVVAAVLVAFFWQTILKIGVAAVIIGFIFLLITGLLGILHGLHTLIS